MRNFIFFFLTISISYCKGQSLLPQTDIALPEELSSKDKPFEFSGLAEWNDRILLIPTLKKAGIKKNENPLMYGIDLSEISSYLDKKSNNISFQKIEIDRVSFDTYISNVHGYDGIEGAVVVGNNIFFSIETDGNVDAELCYIVKGFIENSEKDKAIIYIQKKIAINKEVFVNNEKYGANSGFESLGYLPSEKKLVAFFEDPDNRGRHSFYKIDLDLREANLYILNSPYGDRLADMCLAKGSKFWAISSRYKRINFSKSTLVEIDLLENTVTEIGTLCTNNCAFNWEGVFKFKDGVILVNDNKFGSETNISKLVYAKFPD